MSGEEGDKDIAEDSMVGIQFLIGEVGEVLDGIVTWFCGEEVVERELGGSNDTEALG